MSCSKFIGGLGFPLHDIGISLLVVGVFLLPLSFFLFPLVRVILSLTHSLTRSLTNDASLALSLVRTIHWVNQDFPVFSHGSHTSDGASS